MQIDILFRLPFDWKNPLGYLVAVILQYIMALYCLMLAFCCVFHGIGCCLFFYTIVSKSVKDNLKQINENAAADQSLVADFVEIYSHLKKLNVSDSIRL